MSVAPQVFLSVLGSFATGVTVVTTRSGDTVHGTTMSAFASVSLDPPFVLICVDHNSASRDLIAKSGVFAVNILHKGQAGLSASLADKSTVELALTHGLGDVAHSAGVTGAPILDEQLAYADCRVVNAVEAGDHTIYVGRVEDAGVSPEDLAPLVYFRGKYGGIAPSPEPNP